MATYIVEFDGLEAVPPELRGRAQRLVGGYFTEEELEGAYANTEAEKKKPWATLSHEEREALIAVAEEAFNRNEGDHWDEAVIDWWETEPRTKALFED